VKSFLERGVGKRQEKVWRKYGKGMEKVWEMHGQCMDNAWIMHGKGVEKAGRKGCGDRRATEGKLTIGRVLRPVTNSGGHN
jgi:hypothetical protein